MPYLKHKNTLTEYNFESIEGLLTAVCSGNFQITHRLELRRLVTSLWFDAEMKKQGGANQNDISPLRALTNFKANLKRRKKTSNSFTSSRVMELPEPARAILIADIAYTFRNEIDDYTQIDSGNNKPKGTRQSAAVYRQVFRFYYQWRWRNGYSAPKAK